MSSASQKNLLLQPFRAAFGNNNGLSFSLNSSSVKWSAAFVPPESFTAAKLWLNFQTRTGTNGQYTFRIETDDGTGKPSGTLAWTNATVSATPSASGWAGPYTLTAAGAIAPGTTYHLLAAQDVTDASNFLAVKENGQLYIDASGLPSGDGMPFCAYALRFNGATWSVGAGSPCFSITDSAGTTGFGQVFDSSGNTTVTNTAWAGAKFTTLAPMTVWGCSFSTLSSTTAGACAAKLIDSGNNVLATGTIPAGPWRFITGRIPQIFVFDSPVSLAIGTYRVVVKDPSGVLRFEYASCANSTLKAFKPGGSAYTYTAGTSSNGTASPTSWTDTDSQLPPFSLYASASNGDVAPAVTDVKSGVTYTIAGSTVTGTYAGSGGSGRLVNGGLVTA